MARAGSHLLTGEIPQPLSPRVTGGQDGGWQKHIDTHRRGPIEVAIAGRTDISAVMSEATTNGLTQPLAGIRSRHCLSISVLYVCQRDRGLRTSSRV